MNITATAIILTITSVYMLITPLTLTTSNFGSMMVFKLIPVVLAVLVGILAAIEFGLMVAPS